MIAASLRRCPTAASSSSVLLRHYPKGMRGIRCLNGMINNINDTSVDRVLSSAATARVDGGKTRQRQHRRPTAASKMSALASKLLSQGSDTDLLPPWTLKECRSVIRHYARNPTDRVSVAVRNNDNDDYNAKKTMTMLSGAEVCRTLLRNLIVPEQTVADEEDVVRVIPENQIDAIIEMSLLTIGTYVNDPPRETKRKFSGRIGMEDGQNAESILKRLLSSQISCSTATTTGQHFSSKEEEDDERDEQWQKRSKSLLIMFNTVLHIWSQIGSSSVGRGHEYSREAVMRAEHLLLEMAQRRVNDADGGGDANFNPPRKSGRRKKRLRSLTVVPDVISFNTVLTAWSKSGRSKGIGNGSSSGHDSGTVGEEGTATEAAARAESTLKLMVELGDKQLADDIPTGMGEGGMLLLPNQRSYEAVIQAWSRSPHPNASVRAVALLEDMISRHETYVTKKEDYDDDDDDDGANAELVTPVYPSVRTFTSTIAAVGRSFNHDPRGTLDRAEFVWKTMMGFSPMGNGDVIRPNTVTYNALISLYSKKRHNSESLEEYYGRLLKMDNVVQTMEQDLEEEHGSGSDQAIPDKITFGTAIYGWCHFAEEVMTLTNTRPLRNNASYKRGQKNERRRENELKNKALEGAIKAEAHLLKLAATSDITIHPFNDVLSAYAIVAEPEKAEEIFKLAKSYQEGQGRDAVGGGGGIGGVRVNTTSYRCLMNAYLNAARDTARVSMERNRQKIDHFVSKAEDVLSETDHLHYTDKVSYVRPDTAMYNSVIMALVQLVKTREGLDRAHTWLNKMYARYMERLRDYCIQNTITGVGAEVVSSSSGDMMMMMREMDEAKPNTTTYTTVLSGYRRFHDIRQMEQILLEMETLHKQLTSVPSQHRKRMAHVTPNTFAYNLLLNGYANHDNNHKEGGYGRETKNVVECTTKAETLLDRMEGLYRSGKNKSARPDGNSYRSVIRLYDETKKGGFATKDDGRTEERVLELRRRLNDVEKEENRHRAQQSRMID